MQGQNAVETTGNGHHNGVDTRSVVPHDNGGNAVSAPVAGESAALISMIERAARDPNVDIEKMERLFQMHEQASARAARTAYFAAFSLLQSELPATVRSGKGHDNRQYARYEDLIATLRPFLAKHGFSISYRVDTSGPRVTVTGLMAHSMGHVEETQFSAPPDDSGKKSAIHAMASTISYGKRYVTLTLTGIATEGEDDDAKAASNVAISDAQKIEIEALVRETEADIGWIYERYEITDFSQMTTAQFKEAKAGLSARKRAMGGGK